MFDMRLAWHCLILWLNSSLGELGAGAATVLTHIPPSEMTTQFAVGHTAARPKDHSRTSVCCAYMLALRRPCTSLHGHMLLISVHWETVRGLAPVFGVTAIV